MWRIEMFGGLRASCGERVVDRFPTQRTAALLAYLALFPRTPHPRESLAETLWPDADPESQRHSLRLALSRLRGLLGPDHPLEAGRLAVRLDPARFTTDVAEFEGASARGDGRTARRLYRGPLMPGHYDDWIVEAQARLEGLLDEVKDGDASLPDTLPRGMGRLFGREAERESLQRRLSEGRIVTLTAPGGMGKTRLAVAVARDHGRAVWVALADLSESRQAPDAVRAALRLPVPAPGFPVEDLVARELADAAPLLLVLDNAESLIDDTFRAFVARLIAPPGVALLVTSRRALGMHQETEFPLGPLDEGEGAALFEERARRARPGLVADPEATRALARRLGGMPLALELAAARAGVHGLAEIERGDWTDQDDFGETLGIPVRQRSLDAVLRASLAPLPAEARGAFDRLGVFRGGFDATAALAVAEATPAILETLRRWALLVPEEKSGGLRFRMPEPLRSLATGGTERIHARYFADWAVAHRENELPPPPRAFGQRLADLSRERDNLLAALETLRASDEPTDREAGLRLVGEVRAHWYIQNEPVEMERWARTMLGGLGERADPLVCAWVGLTLALGRREQGDRAGGAAEVEAALSVLRGGPRDSHLGTAWHLRGLTLDDIGQPDEAEAAYVEAEAVWIETDDPRNLSITRHNRAMLAAERGDLNTAERMVGEAMEWFVAHRNTYVAVGHATVGWIRRARGDHARAAAALRDASRVHRELGYVRGWAQNERDLALCLHALGKSNEARRVAEGALADFRRVGDRHGEATALAALARVSGEAWHADEARGILQRHGLPAVGELLEGLRRC